MKYVFGVFSAINRQLLLWKLRALRWVFIFYQLRQQSQWVCKISIIIQVALTCLESMDRPLTKPNQKIKIFELSWCNMIVLPHWLKMVTKVVVLYTKGYMNIEVVLQLLIVIYFAVQMVRRLTELRWSREKLICIMVMRYT